MGIFFVFKHLLTAHLLNVAFCISHSSPILSVFFLTSIYSTRLMLVINFNQKINYNIFVLVFSPFFSSFRHFYRFMAHSFLIHALYLLSSTIQKTHKFCWFFLSLLIISHGISVFKTIINKWLCQPAYKPNEWYTYINTINSFFSIRLKYILIGFLKL